MAEDTGRTGGEEKFGRRPAVTGNPRDRVAGGRARTGGDIEHGRRASSFITTAIPEETETRGRYPTSTGLPLEMDLDDGPIVSQIEPIDSGPEPSGADDGADR